MPMARWVGRLGCLLLVAGCATWAWVAALQGPVDAAATRGSDSENWRIELELYVIDLRLAPLLLAVAGVGLLLAPRVRSFGIGSAVMAGAAVTAEAVTAALEAVGAPPFITSAALLVALVVVVRVGRRWSGPDVVVARRLTVAVGLVLLCSPFPMEVYLDFDAAILEGLPSGYLVSVRVLQGLMLAAGAACLLLGAKRLTVLHAVAAVAGGLGLFFAAVESDVWWQLASLCAVVALVTAAAVAGEGSRPRRVAAAAILSGLLYLPFFWVCLLFQFGLGAVPLELNGGHIDYDGLPVFLSGPLSAVIVVAFVMWGAGWFEPPEADRSPSTSPAPDHVEA